ncbi:MAG: rhomboid family intramembrane serine protease [Armatimonadota bacterium]
MQSPPTAAEQEQVRTARSTTASPRIVAPVVTLSLIAVNLLMALGQLAATGFQLRPEEIGNAPVNWALGVKLPSLVQYGEYWRLVTANFLHHSWGHLATNMLGIYLLGRLVEAFYGHARLLVIFVLSAMTGAVASYLLTPNESLGASTGLMGLLGALIAHNARYRRYLPERVNGMLWFLIAVLLLQLAIDTSRLVNSDGWGHFGGAVGGAIMALLLESRIAGPLQSERDWLPLPTALATAIAVLAYGAFGLASSLPNELDLLRAGRARSGSGITQNLKLVVEQRPYFVEARIFLARVLERMQRHEEAARQYEQVLEQGRANRSLYNQVEVLASKFWLEANLAYEAERWEEALDHYARAARLTQDRDLLAQAHNSIAWMLADKLQRDYPRAERHALLALKARPNDPAITDTLAWTYYRQGRLEEALRTQKRAVGLWEQLPAQPGRMEYRRIMGELTYHLGAIYEAMQRPDEARAYYERALEHRPVYPEALEGLHRLQQAHPAPTAPPPDPAARTGLLS